MAAHVRQTKHDIDTAMLVRGTDRYNQFGVDLPASRDLDPAALAHQKKLEDLHRAIAGSN